VKVRTGQVSLRSVQVEIKSRSGRVTSRSGQCQVKAKVRLSSCQTLSQGQDISKAD